MDLCFWRLAVRPGVQLSAQLGSRIPDQPEALSPVPTCWPLPVRRSASQTLDIRRTRVLSCRNVYLERSSLLSQPQHTHSLSLCLLLDVTSRSTSVPSAFGVILQLTRYINYFTYLFTHLLTYFWYHYKYST